MDPVSFSHVMIDVETLGTSPGSAPFSLAAVGFDAHKPVDPYPLHLNIDVQSAMDAGLTTDPGTIDFWMHQSTDLWETLTDDPVPLGQALSDLGAYVLQKCNEPMVWARGPDFEFGKILEPAHHAIGRSMPWPYYKQRDVRTLCPSGSDGETSHHPLDDARDQIESIRPILRGDTTSEMFGVNA